MPVVDGQPVAAATPNAAFLDAQVDTSALGRITLANTLPESGAVISNVQRGVNSLFDGTGINEAGSTGTDYNAPSGTVDNGDTHFEALQKLANKFDSLTGHTHDSGVPGDGGALEVVETLNNLSGAVALVPSGAVSIGLDGQNINIHAPTGAAAGVNSLNGLTGDITIAPSGEVEIGVSGQDINIFVASGAALGQSEYWERTFSAYASTATKVPRFSTVEVNAPDGFTITDTASGGPFATVDEAGLYQVDFGFDAVDDNTALEMAIGHNVADKTLDPSTQPENETLAFTTLNESGAPRSAGYISAQKWCEINDELTILTNAGTPGDSQKCFWRVNRVR